MLTLDVQSRVAYSIDVQSRVAYSIDVQSHVAYEIDVQSHVVCFFWLSTQNTRSIVVCV